MGLHCSINELSTRRNENCITQDQWGQAYFSFDPKIQILWSYVKIKPTYERKEKRQRNRMVKMSGINCPLTSNWRFEGEKLFLVHVDNESSQSLVGDHTMGKLEKISRAR